jgi:hypothetical protein
MDALLILQAGTLILLSILGDENIDENYNVVYIHSKKF